MTVTIQLSESAADELALALSGRIGSEATNSGEALVQVACVLKPNASGVWSILDDAGHSYLGVSSVSQDTTSITLNFDFTATKVLTLIAAPDETLAKARFNVGASVGLSSAIIQMATPTTSPVNPANVTNTSSNIWIYGLFLV